ncbi:MAG: hypothetical protein NC548_63185 [Lachnospiraceae bacterium]|nr:hypothetical protein [Lachnospiraceae bacterium]
MISAWAKIILGDLCPKPHSAMQSVAEDAEFEEVSETENKLIEAKEDDV